jgi:hypothetical protein
MASKAVLMKAFFEQITSFSKELTEMYPDDADFSLMLTTVQLMKVTNPSIVVRTINANVGEFESKIMAKDESFFLNYSFSEYGDVVEDVNVFTKLKQYISTMTPQTKENVWKYVQNITRLAKACS